MQPHPSQESGFLQQLTLFFDDLYQYGLGLTISWKVQVRISSIDIFQHNETHHSFINYYNKFCLKVIRCDFKSK